MADTLLIVPPFSFDSLNRADENGRGGGGFYLYYPPLGLCSIGAALRRCGFSVRVVDCRIEGVAEKDLPALAARERPAIIGLTVTTPTLRACRRIFKSLREAGFGGALVAGGPHVSSDPEIIRVIGADFGIAGDGEPGMLALARALIRGEGDVDGVPGLARIENGRLSANVTTRVDTLTGPLMPDRTLINESLYFNPYFPSKTTTMLSARGCPHKCAFCSRSDSMGDYRPRPLDEFFDEAEAAARAGYGFVSLIDETFTHDRVRAAALAEGLIARKLGFRWACQTRADSIDREIAALLKRAGCINISFGVEAGASESRRRLDKPVTNEECEAAVRICREAGITTNAFFIIGGPDDTSEDVAAAVEYAVALDPDYAVFNIGTLFPGSRHYERELERGAVTREVWDAYALGETPLPVLSRTLGREELARHLSRAFRRFYMRPRAFLRQLPRMASPGRIAWAARMARTVIRDYANV